MGSPPVPCTAPWSRDPPRPTYLVHAHAGINPIGQVSAFGFAPRVHVEPSSPERVAVPGAPCAHMGKRRAAAAAAQGYSPSVTRTHGISHRRAGSHSGAPSSSLCRHRAATECLCADPVCSVCTLPVRSIGDPLLEQERGVNPSCPLIRGGGAGGALRVTWCALCRECWRERRGREPPAYGGAGTTAWRLGMTQSSSGSGGHQELPGNGCWLDVLLWAACGELRAQLHA